MRILVVSPHPDDETLGAGGTLLRFRTEGNEIYWLNITTIEGNSNFSRGGGKRKTKCTNQCN